MALVYGDVYGLLNGVFDATLLWAVARLFGERVQPARLAVAAGLGGAWSVATLYPAFLPLAGLAGRLLVPTAMVACTFGVGPRFWRRLLSFFLLAFTAAGMALGSAGLFAGSVGVFPRLALTGLALLAIVWAAEGGRRLFRLKAARQGVTELRLEILGRTLKVAALVDSGCRLVDPFTKRPVVVVEQTALEEVLPRPLLQAAIRGTPEDLARILELHPRLAERLCPLPYVSLGRAAGLLWGFRGDAVRVADASGEVAATEVVVGIAPHALSHSGEFHALVPSAIYEQATNRVS